jgi:methionyl-tRNA formyltransferase
VLTPRRLAEPEFLETLRALAPDCCAIVAYGALVPRAALDVPRYGWVNLHFSLLPAWRGAAPVQAALRHGDEITGATTFRLEEGLDTGPVYGVVTEAVAPTDTAGDLLERLSVSGAALLAATVDGIADGTVVPVPQPAEGVSHAPKVTASDARVEWAAPTAAVDRLVRSVTPDPGAWTTFRGERLGLGPVRPLDPADSPELKPGELHVEKRRMLVGTVAAPVVLGEVRPVGRRPMPAPDWARGVRITAGEVLR